MEVLLIGAGVIGSVYGAHLVSVGHRLAVFSPPGRPRGLSNDGLRVRDATSDAALSVPVDTVCDSAGPIYALVLVALRAEQLHSSFAVLQRLDGSPHIIFLGNNPEGHRAVQASLPGTSELGFPGIGGVMRDGTVDYVRIRQQPTTLETAASPASKQFDAALRTRGFKVTRTSHIDGWLAYHAIFVACVSAALARADVDAARLAANRPTVALMCAAIEEGFAVLKSQRVEGLPSNLALLHHPLIRPFAVRYWRRQLRSPMGELAFAGHTRRAGAEMATLAGWVLNTVDASPVPHDHLGLLLRGAK